MRQGVGLLTSLLRHESPVVLQVQQELLQQLVAGLTSQQDPAATWSGQSLPNAAAPSAPPGAAGNLGLPPGFFLPQQQAFASGAGLGWPLIPHLGLGDGLAPQPRPAASGGPRPPATPARALLPPIPPLPSIWTVVVPCTMQNHS